MSRKLILSYATALVLSVGGISTANAYPQLTIGGVTLQVGSCTGAACGNLQLTSGPAGFMFSSTPDLGTADAGNGFADDTTIGFKLFGGLFSQLILSITGTGFQSTGVSVSDHNAIGLGSITIGTDQGTNAGTFTVTPADNVLNVIADIGSGDGFVVPGMTDSFSVAVPEPASFGVLAVSLAITGLRRRKR
jgi:hypothetical protein